jgi:hypothetical protein
MLKCNVRCEDVGHPFDLTEINSTQVASEREDEIYESKGGG